MKAGLANNCIKYAHIYMSLFAIATYGVVTYYLSSNENSADIVAKRATNKTGVKYFFYFILIDGVYFHKDLELEDLMLFITDLRINKVELKIGLLENDSIDYQ
jgi:hypothetical protein